jgi:excisionase family DNA binding protein
MPLNAPLTFALGFIKNNKQMENLTEGLTLETLPKAFTHLTNEVSEIKRLLLEKSNEQPTETDRWFDLNELCIYHPDKPSKPTVYGWVNAGIIPVHKGGKKLRFLKSEIDIFLKQGRKKTLAETVSEVDTYLKKKGAKNE